MRAPFVLALLVLLVAPLAPLAAADHVYSHRYVVVGRVLDAEGHPVPNVTVALGFRNATSEGSCAAQPGTETDAWGRTETRPVTNRHGEFLFCAHLHTVSRSVAGELDLSLPDHGVARRAPLDPGFRSSYVVLRLPAGADVPANGTATNATHTVAGRLWREAPGEGVMLENVRVFGHTVNRVPVNVTLTLGDGTQVRANGTTNNYGDFALRLPVPQGAAARGKLVVEALGRDHEADVDESGLTYLKMRADGSAPAPATPTPTPGGTAPAATTPAPTVTIPISPVTNGDDAGGGVDRNGTRGTAPTGGSPQMPFPAPVLVLGLLAGVALALRRRRA